MKLTNIQIYNYSMALLSEFDTNCNIKLPVKINFFLQKNIQVIKELAQEIEQARVKIASAYGVLSEDGESYSIPADKTAEVQKELNDLLLLEQEVEIRTFKLDDFSDIDLTFKQMNALMFMIEE